MVKYALIDLFKFQNIVPRETPKTTPETKIISLLKDELWGNLNFPAYYFCPETGEYQQFDSRMLTLIAEIRAALGFKPTEYQSYQQELSPLVNQEMAQCAGKELKAEFPHSGLPITVLQAILGGKVHQTLIDDTPGGHQTCMKIILNTIRMIRVAGGKTDIYTITRADSAGAEIAYEGDNLYTTQDAKFLFHAASTAPRSQIVNQEYRETAQARFQKTNDCPAKERVLAEIARECSRIEFEVTGQDLYDLGLATKLFPNQGELIRHFKQTTGWKYNPRGERILDEYLRKWYTFSTKYWETENEARESFAAFLDEQ